ncbi:MAG: vitamin K epoxide reductase family protein [Firmicutes bacterium]|nr:vitamin K epoxide reductase family protein [Bacillota bacterium]
MIGFLKSPVRKAAFPYLGTAVLSFIGITATVYLGWQRLSGSAFWCLGGEGCGAVNASPYAELNGIPLVFLGLSVYLVLFILAVVSLRLRPAIPLVLPLAIFGFSLAGTLFSLYLTWIEGVILRAWCAWCLVSAGTIFGIFIINLLGLTRWEGESGG